MKTKRIQKTIVFLISMLLFVVPTLVSAQSGQAKQSRPPIASPLVREGNFAIEIVSALALGTITNEVEAESLLGGIGIALRNGWLANYPVTPDIMGELQKSVADATNAVRLGMSKDEALRRLNDVNSKVGPAAIPYAGHSVSQPPSAENYPDATVVDNCSYEEGPPVYTYYAPPPDFGNYSLSGRRQNGQSYVGNDESKFVATQGGKP